MNATEPIRRRALHTPDAAAYESASGTTVTYAIVERTINEVARRLHARGLVPGQSAAVATDDHYRYIVAALALARLGVTFAPVMLPAHLTDVLLQDRGTQGNGGARTVAFEDVWPEDLLARDDAPPVPFPDDDAAILMHCPSSGTTGGPKFVPVSHALALRRVDSRAHGPAVVAARTGSASMRQACLVSPSTSYGFTSVLFALCSGGTVLQPNLDARQLPEWLARSRVDRLVGSPLALQKIAEVLPALRAPNSLAIVEAGGGALSLHVHRLVSERMCGNIYINYGSTECGRVAGAPASVTLDKAGAVGYAYPGVEIQIVDDDDEPLPLGREGIVRIRSERNAGGYLEHAQEAALVFRSGWVYPGDRGVLEPDGLLRVVGRVDDVINRGGVKINPQTIEDAMMALGDVREVAVFGAPAGGGITAICAAIVPIGALDADAYHARCRERLGPQAPVLIMHLRELPRNANGKVLRHELARIALEASSVQPASR